MKDLAIGIDLGGTNLKGVVMEKNGAMQLLTRVPTQAAKGGQQVLKNIIGLVSELMAKQGGAERIIGVGIGTPGFIDGDGTILGGAENIPGWKRTQVFQPILQATGLRVVAGNDVTVAALAESRYGAGRGVQNVALLALGTGIGGGVMINGHVYKGTHGMAAELGHIPVETGGRQCNCGQRGCVEQYASSPGIAANAREFCKSIPVGQRTAFVEEVLARPDQVSAKTVYEYLNTGDPVALRVHEYSADMLARAVGVILNVLSPDRVILGGGVMKRNHHMVDSMTKLAPRYAWPQIAERCDYRMAECGEDAGVKGAAALVFDELV
jgi:glucokinase